MGNSNILIGGVVGMVGYGIYLFFKERTQPKDTKPREIRNYEDFSLKQNKTSGSSIRGTTHITSKATQQNEEFIALLKSTIKENRLDIIPDSDLIEICKRAKSIDASSNNLDIELSKTINTLLEEIKKRGITQEDNPQEISNYENSYFAKQAKKRLRAKVIFAIILAISVALILYVLIGIRSLPINIST